MSNLRWPLRLTLDLHFNIDIRNGSKSGLPLIIDGLLMIGRLLPLVQICRAPGLFVLHLLHLFHI